MAAPHLFVTQLPLTQSDQLLKGLKERGFEISHPPYTLFSGKSKGISCTLYESGKLVVQGKEMGQFIEFYLEPEILQNFSYTHHEVSSTEEIARIGIDESGKGDY